MRNITANATEAFWAGKKFRKGGSGETEVEVDDAEVTLLLHGSVIARRPRNGTSLEISAAGWSTLTTKERLNGVLQRLGYGIWQSNFVWYCNVPFDHPLHSGQSEDRETIQFDTSRGAWTLIHPGSDLERLAATKEN